MMVSPESKSSEGELDYEWVEENGKLVKITQENSNGRKCKCCGCDCPCKCKCCRMVCCSCKASSKNEKI